MTTTSKPPAPLKATVLVQKFTIDRLGKYQTNARSVAAADAALQDRREWAQVAPPRIE